MNPGMQTLHPYPFEKLADLTRDVIPSDLPRIALTIGEPKHQPPAHVLEALVASIGEAVEIPNHYWPCGAQRNHRAMGRAALWHTSAGSKQRSLAG